MVTPHPSRLRVLPGPDWASLSRPLLMDQPSSVDVSPSSFPIMMSCKAFAKGPGGEFYFHS